MQKKILIAVFGLFASGIWSQNDAGAKFVTISQSIQKSGYGLQVGLPYLGQNKNDTERTISPFDTRFPWNVLYLYSTFTEESFDVSKGYYGDKVLVSWNLRSNFDLVRTIKIYRRKYNASSASTSWGTSIASVSKDVTQYEDKYIEGGVLYEYKVVAEGVSPIESLYSTYITGIGFRNPTAVVTGNVSFKGGNPVRDVAIRASTQGSAINFGSALRIPGTGQVEVNRLTKLIGSETTLEAWLKPGSPYTDDSGASIRLFELGSSLQPEEKIDVTVNLKAATHILEVNIGGSVYSLKNYYPSGNMNGRGEDILVPVANFNDQFIHFSVVIKEGVVPLLFINGREINEEFKDVTNQKLIGIDADYTAPYFEVGVPTQVNSLSLTTPNAVWDDFYLGSGKDAIIDEVRVWNKVKDASAIRADYRRYIDGDSPNLVIYLRANEGVGAFVYDFSRNGFIFNKNNGKLGTSTWTTGLGNIPTASQLGVLGITDKAGNYVISGIPYSGSGETFTITPSYDQHQFEPNQQLLFLGQGSEVVNKINFTDISSFNFKGKIFFDSRGIFRSFVQVNSGNLSTPVFNNLTEGDQYVSGPGILDEGYNYYEKNGTKFSKGEYWYNDRGTPNDDTDDYIERYARIGSEGVNVYIDGVLVFDKNGKPIVSDAEGNFEISVPIGNHSITIKKEGHTFVYDGRFPANPESFKEFFENAEEQVVFVDNTKVTLVGRVVGGPVEAQKAIGFGDKGLFEKSKVDVNGESKKITISSKNNIGVANITLGYKPLGGNETPYTRFNFSTNSQTGEYRVSLLPLNYEINQVDGLLINTNSRISLLKANEAVIVSKITPLITPEFKYEDGTKETGTAYHYEKSFTYRTVPVLKVVEQTSDKTIKVEDVDISTDGFAFPVYTQSKLYKIVFENFERYLNSDFGAVGEDIVPITDGKLKITNNLAMYDTITPKRDINDPKKIIYTFEGGIPALVAPFTNNIDIKYVINNVAYDAENYIKNGIILGGKTDGTKSFITKGPEMPDIILRDPPGSNSSATIESGQTLSYNFTSKFGGDLSLAVGWTKHLGGEVVVSGGPVPTPETRTQFILENNLGITGSVSSNGEQGYTKTYTFSKSISTSDNPNWVGADADLYIGTSHNYQYGSYDKVLASSHVITNSDLLSFKLTNSLGQDVFISKQKAMYFSTQASETAFVYSQRQILEQLIPEIELIISNLENGVISATTPGVLSVKDYKQQIRLWKGVILDNEKNKYLVKNKIEYNKDKIYNVIENHSNVLNVNPLKASVEDLYFENISFDAGVGSIDKSFQTEVLHSTSNSTKFEVKIDEGFVAGSKINGIGSSFYFKMIVGANAGFSAVSNKVSKIKVGYSLKDNDPANLLSVDVTNLFDGQGPIFSTVGGQTSCPYEGAEKSIFYNDIAYNTDSNPTVINILPEEKRELLSNATVQVEKPLLSVDVASVTNVPEGDKAEFMLRLTNGSDIKSNVPGYNYYTLFVDNKSNQNNATTNIGAWGLPVNIPYGKTVDFKLLVGKAASDVFDYDNLKIRLQSNCDSIHVKSDVFISAHFVKSCSKVVVNAPLNNWVYNIETAFNLNGTSKPLLIKMNGFNPAFGNFKKIDLEYRLATSSTWTRLQTYYGSQKFYDEAALNNETAISLIKTPELSFPLDIVGLKFQDGKYEVRARSTCTNGTVYVSEVVSGRVDLTEPQRFGTPLPIDGILSAGEDIKVSFNEPIFYNSAVSNIEIKGETNQLPINHNVSLNFEGSNNSTIINNPKITKGDLTFEFWLNNRTTASTASIIGQDGGLSIKLDKGSIYFTLGGFTAKGAIANDNLFHHYTFTHNSNTGNISIYQDDTEIGGTVAIPNLDFTNNNALVIGGNSFIGSIHDLRLWNKTISLENAYASMYSKLVGNENSIIGYWPMTEGRGALANDLARFKHAIVKTSWDIKPKGTSYEFNNQQYLKLNNVNFVQLTNKMDATVSFWIKTGVSQDATVFSNGKGDGSDVVQSNGFANKWAININKSGILTLESEGRSYILTDKSVADDSWHHIALSLNRLGSLKTYVDAKPVSSNRMTAIGGFSGSKVWLGARGSIDLEGKESVDRTFLGKIDEFRLWNTLLNSEQISRDRFNEVDVESIGLLLYSRMNAPSPANANGPTYYHAYSNQTVIPSNALLSSGTVSYSSDAPAIKPERALIKFKVNHVVNQSEMILEPVINDLAALEGQMVDITVSRMFDDANNMQQSPITWTAYIKRNEVSWFADGYNEIVDLVKKIGEKKSFEITILNKGGKGQPFTITNLPSWLKLSKTTGTLEPNGKTIITATIDNELTSDEYLENLFLKTDFGYDEKLPIKLRVLAPEPDWKVDPKAFANSMNIVGRVKINGNFSTDSYDKIAAIFDGKVIGVANLVYDAAYQEYFAYLTVYSNTDGENIRFSIWDASEGKIMDANIDAKPLVVFQQNTVMGSLTKPMIFANTSVTEQEIKINRGWTWISMNVADPNFSNLNFLTKGLALTTNDKIQNNAQFDLYLKKLINSNSSWNGTISSTGGLSVSKMYKVYMANAQTLNIKGTPVSISTWSFPIQQNWNWLPYPLGRNQSTNEALAYFDAKDGDVIKSQDLFAIYDPLNGWKGTLAYLEAGKGYMIKSSKAQTFSYPSYLGQSNNIENKAAVSFKDINQEEMRSEFKQYSQNMNAVVLLPKGYDELLVYDTNEVLKGIAHRQVVDGKELAFITIYGETPETLYVFVGDGISKKRTKKIFMFKNDDVLGTIENPIVLEDGLIDKLIIYPNPFIDDLHFTINAKEKQEVKIQLLSMDGKLVFTNKMNVVVGNNNLVISPQVPTGNYLLQIEVNGDTLTNKVIKN